MRQETYISIDVETTGPVPGLFSMIDIGACSVLDTSNIFSASLKELPGASWSEDTLQFWQKNRDVLHKIQSRADEIGKVMDDFNYWLRQFYRPVLIGFPITFDFAFINYYYWYVFKSEPPFGWGGMDLKTMGALKTGNTFKDTTKKFLKRHLPQGPWHHMKHTHLGIDDAVEQAELFKALMRKTDV